MTTTDSRTGTPGRRRIAVGARLAGLSLLSFLGVAGVYLVTVHTVRGQEIENALLDTRRDARGASASADLLATVSVWSLVAAIGLVGFIALVRGRPRLALGAGAIIGLSAVTTEVLKKRLLSRPELDPGAALWQLDNIFPSGHTTIAMATAVALVLVVPYRLRGLAAVAGGAYATGIAVATLAAGWHRTGDALGAIFLVVGIALGACSVLVLWRGAGHPKERPLKWAWIPLAITAAGGMAVVAVGGPETIREIDHTDLVTLGPQDGLAVTFALVAVAVVAGMAVLLTALRDVSLDTPRRVARERTGAGRRS
jgi:membrane-associated phospholipid phosphatase